MPPEGDVSYAHVLRLVKKRVNLSEFAIEAFRLRRAVTGELILEVPGDNAVNKADLVADEFRRVLADEEVRVSRPTRRAKLRIRGFDESVVPEEVALVVSRAGECDFFLHSRWGNSQGARGTVLRLGAVPHPGCPQYCA